MANDKLNLRLERVRIVQLNVGEAKIIQNGKNKGKNYWRVGLKTQEGWMNMTVFSEDDMNKCRQLEDKTIHLSVWEEEWENKKYTNCKFPSREDLLDIRIQELEEKMAKFSKFIRYYCEKNPEAAEELKQFN